MYPQWITTLSLYIEGRTAGLATRMASQEVVCAADAWASVVVAEDVMVEFRAGLGSGPEGLNFSLDSLKTVSTTSWSQNRAHIQVRLDEPNGFRTLRIFLCSSAAMEANTSLLTAFCLTLQSLAVQVGVGLHRGHYLTVTELSIDLQDFMDMLFK